MENKIEQNKVKKVKQPKKDEEKYNFVSSKRIKELIEKNDYTADFIAKKLKISRRSYFNKVKGELKNPFTLSEAFILIKLLNCEFEDIIKTKDELTENEFSILKSLD